MRAMWLGRALRGMARSLFAASSGLTLPLVRALDRLSRLPWLRDLFTSDAFVAHTAVYGWIANQFGHFAIGVAVGAAPWIIPTSPALAWLLVLAFAALYLLKELTDARGEAELSRKLGSPFAIDEQILANDGIADTLFVWLGLAVGFAAAQPGEASWLGLLGWLIGVAAVASGLGAWQLPGRAAFDGSGLPRYVALSRYNGRFQGSIDGEVDASAMATLAEALQSWTDAPPEPPSVITVEGPSGFGKTTLACAIARAHTDRARKVRYVHATDLPLGEVHRDGLEVLVVEDIPSGAVELIRLLETPLEGRVRTLVLTHAGPLDLDVHDLEVDVRVMQLDLTAPVRPNLDEVERDAPDRP